MTIRKPICVVTGLLVSSVLSVISVLSVAFAQQNQYPRPHQLPPPPAANDSLSGSRPRYQPRYVISAGMSITFIPKDGAKRVVVADGATIEFSPENRLEVITDKGSEKVKMIPTKEGFAMHFKGKVALFAFKDGPNFGEYKDGKDRTDTELLMRVVANDIKITRVPLPANTDNTK